MQSIASLTRSNERTPPLSRIKAEDNHHAEFQNSQSSSPKMSLVTKEETKSQDDRSQHHLSNKTTVSPYLESKSQSKVPVEGSHSAILKNEGQDAMKSPLDGVLDGVCVSPKTETLSPENKLGIPLEDGPIASRTRSQVLKRAKAFEKRTGDVLKDLVGEDNVKEQVFYSMGWRKFIKPDFVVSHGDQTCIVDAKNYELSKISKKEVDQVDKYRDRAEADNAVLILCEGSVVPDTVRTYAQSKDVHILHIDNHVEEKMQMILGMKNAVSSVDHTLTTKTVDVSQASIHVSREESKRPSILDLSPKLEKELKLQSKTHDPDKPTLKLEISENSSSIETPQKNVTCTSKSSPQAIENSPKNERLSENLNMKRDTNRSLFSPDAKEDRLDVPTRKRTNDSSIHAAKAMKEAQPSEKFLEHPQEKFPVEVSLKSNQNNDRSIRKNPFQNCGTPHERLKDSVLKDDVVTRECTQHEEVRGIPEKTLFVQKSREVPQQSERRDEKENRQREEARKIQLQKEEQRRIEERRQRERQLEQQRIEEENRQREEVRKIQLQKEEERRIEEQRRKEEQRRIEEQRRFEEQRRIEEQLRRENQIREQQLQAQRQMEAERLRYQQSYYEMQNRNYMVHETPSYQTINHQTNYQREGIASISSNSSVTSNGSTHVGYYESRGSANGRELFRGPRGGHFYYTSGGNKKYV